ncbi:MAG: tail fiber domain-containing protein, partial [Proteobacteria bacterium]
MTTGQVLGWNGTAWESVDTVPTNSVTTTKIIDGAVTGDKIANGTITGADLASNVSITTTGGFSTSGTVASNISTSRDLRLYDAVAAPNEHYFSLKAPAALSQNYNFTWPLDYGTANQVLTTDGAGVLTWAAPAASTQWTTVAAGIHYSDAGKFVGIGTATPATALDVVGTGKFSTSIITPLLTNAPAASMVIAPAKPTTNAVGGNLSVRGGAGSDFPATAGAGSGGNLYLKGGSAGTGGNQTGGLVEIAGGQAYGSSGAPVLITGGASDFSTGGLVSINGGATTGTGTGGAVSITAAPGNGTNQNGGNVTITAGAATGTGTTGHISLMGGNVGIGTGTPADKLTVSGLISGGSYPSAHRNTLDLSSDNGVFSAVTYNLDVGASPVQFLTVKGNVLGTGDVFFQGKPLSNGYTVLEGFGGKGLALATGSALPIVFSPNRTERVRIDGAGKLGVGTAAPLQMLDVNGAVRVGDNGALCDGTLTGSIRYNGSDLQFCNGSWQTIGVAGAGISSLTGDVTASGSGAATSTIAAKAVTLAKMQDIATGSLLGRSTAATGAPEVITVGSGLTLASGTLTAVDTFAAALPCAAGYIPFRGASSWTCKLGTNLKTNDSVVVRDSFGSLAANDVSASSISIANSSSAVVLQSPAGANYTLSLPGTAGSSGNVLTTNGSGVLTWTSPAASSVTGLAFPSVGSTIVGVTNASSVTAGTPNNTAVGYHSMHALTTGSSNVAVGEASLSSLTTGSNNTAVGRGAGSAITTEDSNTSIGWYSLQRGVDSTSVGMWALTNNTTGSKNHAFGKSSLYSNTTGSNNVAMGHYSLFQNQTNSESVAIGNSALENSRGNDNTAVGNGAGYANTSGAANIYIGRNAGNNVTTGGSNIIIGANVGAPSATASNQLNIGNLVFGNTNTKFMGVNTSTFVKTLTVNGGVSASDESNFSIGSYTDTSFGILAPFKTHIAGGNNPVAGFTAGVSGTEAANLNSYGAYVNNASTTSGTGVHYGIYVLGNNNYFSGNVGVGVLSPTAALDIAKTSTLTSGSATNVVNTITANPTAATSADFWAGKGTAAYSSTQTSTGAIRGAEFTGSNSNSATISGSYGIVGQAANISTGTITSAIGAYGYVSNTSTGSISTAKGGTFNVANTGGGTITNGYGIYINGVQATNKWSVYAADATAPSYFSGSVGIGNTAPSEKLEVSGNVKATSFISTSDIRLKKNVVKTPGLDFVRQLTGVTWQWKSTNQTDAGVIAQDVERVMPYAVVTDEKTGFKAVKYNALVAPLIEST